VPCSGGTCGSAIQIALNGASDGDTIYVCAGTFTRVTFNPNGGPTKQVTIIGAGDGEGSDSTIVNGQNVDRPAIRINPGWIVTLQGIRITGVSADQDSDQPGGGVWSEGTLTMIDCTITGNTAFGAGGGIRNDGSLTMVGCTVSHNENSDQSNGAGGILNNGTLNLEDCRIEQNSTAGNGGGIFVQTGHVDLDSDCRVTGNEANTIGAGYTGGGIYNQTGDVTLGGDFPGMIVTLNNPDNCDGIAIAHCG